MFSIILLQLQNVIFFGQHIILFKHFCVFIFEHLKFHLLVLVFGQLLGLGRGVGDLTVSAFLQVEHLWVECWQLVGVHDSDGLGLVQPAEIAAAAAVGQHDLISLFFLLAKMIQ